MEYRMTEHGSGAQEVVTASSNRAAMALLRNWLAEGDYPDIMSTIWVDGSVARKVGRRWDEIGSVTVPIDPDPPKCADDQDHDWQSPIGIVGGLEENPGVHGHGGGVVIAEVCMRCGTERIEDTWAQRPDTGEQGLRSVKYDPYKHKDEVGA